MSRSYRKAVLKDRPRNYKISQFANRIIRRVQGCCVRGIALLTDIEAYSIPDAHSIFSDYNYCDYKFVLQFNSSPKSPHNWRDGEYDKTVKKLQRK